MTYDQRAFNRDVIARWGSINDCLVDDAELLHVQMAHLGRSVRGSFEKGDGKIGKEILEFLETLLARKDTISEIENAIAISFLELDELQSLGIADHVPQRILRIAREQYERWQQAT